jgi:heptosyltransferase-2
MKPHRRKVLVVGPSWVGDMVMAQSLFKNLHQQISELWLSVLAPSWSLPLVERMPEVTAAIPTPFQHGRLSIRDRLRLAHQVHSERFDHAIILPQSFKSALVPFLAGIPLRTGFLGEKRYGLLNDIRHINLKESPQTVEQFVQLGQPVGSVSEDPNLRPKLIANPGRAKKIFQRLGIQLSKKPVLAICPGAAFGPAKRWPAAHFAQVAKLKLQQGWQVWLIGSDQDAPITAEISDLGLADLHDLAGRTRLEEVVDLLSAASYVISNDSGLMHVAAAVDTPVIAIYGSTSPKANPPLSPHATILWEDLSCSPCQKRACPLKHTNCLHQLPVDRVINALDLANTPSTSSIKTDSPPNTHL